jgi:acetamidase/formamidase
MHDHGGEGCALSGCGEATGSWRVRDEVMEELCRGRERDRLAHMEEVDPATLDAFLTARGRERRALLRSGGLAGALAVVGRLFSSVARADAPRAGPERFLAAAGGKVHTVPSSEKTVRLGVFDSTLPDILQIDPGDTIVYPDTWSHFLNKLQPGTTIEQLADLRVKNPGKGPHSIIGPVGVRGAEPGDALEIQFLRVQPVDWAANFNNPGSLNTGALPDVFPEGQVRYFKLDWARRTTAFSDDIHLPLAPFQGTIGLSPPDGFFGATGGVVSSVPPGPHAGNMDLREMGEGTRLYVPVWKAGGRIFTGDSHALQGDGEVNLTALETAMKELRIRVLLHKNAGLTWPFVETETDWIALGMDKDLGVAHRIALLSTIDFLSRRAGLTRLDAYALASVAVSFRVTQVVDANKGVHAMIPKRLFAPALAKRMTVA